MHINNSINDLSEYLKNNSLSLTLKQANFDWDYENDLNFKCKYFILGDELKIYHTSSFFNEDVFENKISYIAGVSSSLNKEIPAGQLIKKIASLTNGSGGGRNDVAQGGGKDISSLNNALELIKGELIKW